MVYTSDFVPPIVGEALSLPQPWISASTQLNVPVPVGVANLATPTSPSELILYFHSLLWYTKRTTEKGVWNHMDASKIIRLTEEEQAYLKKYIRTGTHPAKSIIRAQALLRLDRTGKTDHVHYNRIAADIGISKQGLYNMRDSYLETHNIEKYLSRKKRETPPVPAKIDGRVEAEIIKIACSEPPEGHCRWSLELIKERVIELEILDSISKSSVHSVLKKRNLSLI